MARRLPTCITCGAAVDVGHDGDAWRLHKAYHEFRDEDFNVEYVDHSTSNERLSIPATGLSTDPPSPLLADRLDPIEGSILFGPGGVGKGALACEYIRRLVNLGHTVYILDFEDHGGEWGRRMDGLGVDRSFVHWAAPFKAGLSGLLDQRSLDIIVADIRRVGATYVVIDSIVVACAGRDVSDPTTPALYAQALQAIGLPSLSLAHVTKLHDVRYPFGSAFWHNLARVTWSLIEKGGDILLTNRKASNYRRQGAYTVTFDWLHDVLREVNEQPASTTLMERIVEALTEAKEPMSVAAMLAIINEGLPKEEHTSAATVRAALSREVRNKGQAAAVTTAGEGAWTLRQPA